MADNIDDIKTYYDNYPEHDRLERHQLERDITWKYLDKYLPKRGRILEIGAGTGAYTIPLGKRGYEITAIDLSPKLTEACQKRVIEEKLQKTVTCMVGDGRDLSMSGDKIFDAVLIMGPLYHLVKEEDRTTALSEAYKRLEPEGKIFSTFICRYGIWGNILKNMSHYVEYQNDLKSVLEKGRDAELAYRPGNFRGYFSTVQEIVPLHDKIGFKKLVMAGLEPCISADDESYNNLSGEQRNLWLNLLFSLSTEETTIGASSHILYIGEKAR